MSRSRILVVDNEELIRLSMVDILTEAGFDVDDASSTDDALVMLDTGIYKLLITEVCLPGKLDGIGLAWCAGNREPALPIVFLTGRPDSHHRAQEAGLGGIALTKPCGIAAIMNAVRELV